jgi:hypothetical protein
MKISLQAQDLVFELLSDKVTDLLDSSLIFIEVRSGEDCFFSFFSFFLSIFLSFFLFFYLSFFFLSFSVPLFLSLFLSFSPTLTLPLPLPRSSTLHPFAQYEPLTLPKIPHEMVTQLVDFLSSTFMWLSHLPSAAREVRERARISAQYIVHYCNTHHTKRSNRSCTKALTYRTTQRTTSTPHTYPDPCHSHLHLPSLIPFISTPHLCLSPHLNRPPHSNPHP